MVGNVHEIVCFGRNSICQQETQEDCLLRILGVGGSLFYCSLPYTSGPCNWAKRRQLCLKMPQFQPQFRSEGVGAGEEGRQDKN